MSIENLATLLNVSLKELGCQLDKLVGNLGLDSLTLTRLRGMLVPPPSYQVLDGLTVAEVAEKLSQITEYKMTTISHEDNVAFNLTPMQEAYLLGTSEGCPCQVYTEFDVENLNVELLQEAVRHVVNKHPMLRAAIINGTQQIIRTESEWHELISLKIRPFSEECRFECMTTFSRRPDLHWDIQLSLLPDNKIRIHLLLDMLFIDATSSMQLLKETVDYYNERTVSPGNTLSFQNYCNSIEAKKVSDESITYWKERCNWMPGPPQLPRIKQSDTKVNFQRESVVLKADAWNMLKKRACNLKISPNSILLAAFSEVLRLYAEEPSFTVTVTMSERPVSLENDFSQVVGEFTNVVLCPITQHHGNNLDELATSVHNQIREGLEHSDYGGLEVVRLLRKMRSDPHLRFPIVFTSFLGIVQSDIKLDGCNTNIHYQQTQTPQITLDHQVYEFNGELLINWDYDSSVYEKGLINSMLERYYFILENPDYPLMISEKMLELRISMNKTERLFNEPSLLHELFLRSACKSPDAVAVIDQDMTLTYVEIVMLSRAVAIHLQEAGVKPNSCVAIIMEKGWEQVVAAIGTLMTGAFYIPLNASYPPERLRNILSKSDCKVALIQDGAVRNGLGEISSICVNRDLAKDVSEGRDVSVQIDPDQLAYVIFTSGSTGEPKGVEITHRSAANTCLDINDRFGLGEKTVTFGISSLSFDLSVWDIFGTLSTGGCLVICKPEGTRDPGYWWNQLQNHGVTIWNSVPTSFEMLIAAHPPDAILPLKTVLLSGDAITMSMIESVRSKYPELRIIALGGATEASIWSNYHVVSEETSNFGTKLVPYGRALSNQTIYVLDSRFQFRPDGVVGEIYIGGAGLARGYLNDPELTSSKFFLSRSLGRLYSTGDLGRYLSNGEIEILGRRDSQIKVGGHRVELGEIESCAQRLPSVRQAAVVHLSTSPSVLMGFFTAEGETEGLEEMLRLHVERLLPDYMVPRLWILLEEIPLTTNSKIDRTKLKEMAKTAMLKNQGNSLSENSIEVSLILQLVSQVLRIPVETLSPTQSLIEQGLSSLFAVQLINLLSEAWNTKLSYTVIFNYPSAVQLAGYRKGISQPIKEEAKEYRAEPIAIISTACRLPGDVFSPDEFWEMIFAGTDCMSDVPTSRFDIDEIFDSNPEAVGRSYSRKGAFMNQVESFDHDFFGIPEAEARGMDPQQRILLEVAYEAFHFAGYDKETLKGSSTGVFIGQMNYDWMIDFGYSNDYAGTGSAPSITSNRISFILDLVGPSMTIDTACSSSLVAVDAAVTKLRSGACRMALAGGVNLILSPKPYIMTCQARMLSVNSRCATFDSEANGIARGEGVGAIVLKRLSDAQADGDTILAVIRGSAINQDGRSASLTAPNGLAQENVIQRALDNAGLRGNDIDYVECHGTGTSLGDPIEVEALKNVLGRQREKPVVLGAVKTNIGHLEGAAGIIGLIKTVEVLRRRQVPCNVHFKALNPKINMQGFAAVIPTKLTELSNEGSIFAGVSSFGYGGTNAHVVLESYDRITSSHIARPKLFRYVPLLWNKQHQPCIYESIWEPISKPTILSKPDKCLFLSRVPVSFSLPPGWKNCVITGKESLSSLMSNDWDTVVFFSAEREDDIEIGLNILQNVGENIREVIFVAPHGGLWGLARTFRLENPGIQMRCIACQEKQILEVISYKSEDEICVDESGTFFVKRFHQCCSGIPLRYSLNPQATYVISGGLGALGLVVAKSLIEGGAKYLLLLSKSPKSLPELAGQDVHIQCITCDVSSKGQISEAYDWLLKNQWPSVRGVIHAAGVLTDGLIQNQSVGKLGQAYASKVDGARNLRSVFAPPDFFFLFSSIAAAFGSVGQASYAAANAELNSLAELWSKAGENVLSIQWGAWSEVGMAVRHNAVKHVEELGFGSLSNSLGTQMLQHLMAHGKRGVVIVSPIDWKKIEAARKPVKKNNKNSELWSKSKVQSLVRDCILRFLPKDKIKGNPTFMEAGFSSLDLVQFRQQLIEQLPDSIELPVHFAFNYPTEQDVVEHLHEQLKETATKNVQVSEIWTLLNDRIEGSPLFLISGVVGTVERTFGTLAAALSRPVYAVKPAIPAEIGTITIESLASELKEAMLKESPSASYTIGGLSFGACLALEIGKQLEEEGKLSQIILLDPRHMPPFKTSNPAPFETLLERYTPSMSIKAPVLLFQCTVPPLENQSEMMRETSRSFQSDSDILERCRALCLNLKVVKSEGHHFNLLYKYCGPIAAKIENSFELEKSTAVSEPIAIIGSACRLPGNVTSPEEFWNMLIAGTDCVSDIPSSRFDIDEVYHPDPNSVGFSYTCKGAFMNKVENFDYEFFGISLAEARAMDPQQRILLEVAYDAFDNAGYDKIRLRGSPTSVHVGLANDDWTTMGRDDEAYSPHFGAGVSGSIVSNRISYLLGLTGPSMTIDTACSSSLVAVDLAVEKLRRGICSLALVGGVNVMLHHRMFVSACATKALSPSGRCATFDIAADGYCRGEGAGAIVLKRLSDAKADGDRILAVIRGTAVNQDGRSVSLTAPNGLAQEAVIKDALSSAGLEGCDVDYIECHGTGTPLGDPIEIASLKNVLGIQRQKPLILGAVKTNIGHLEGAAGVVGLIKVVEVLRHRQAPAIVHFKTLNPNINLQKFNAIIPTKSIELGVGSLIAGISSFGFGGTNAHVILESYPDTKERNVSRIVYKPQFIPWRRFPHPFLGRKQVILSGELAEMWNDHRIGGQVMIPAASHLTYMGGTALMRNRAAVGVEIFDVIMTRPLIVNDAKMCIRCVLQGTQWNVQGEINGVTEQYASCRDIQLLSEHLSTDIDPQVVQEKCLFTDLEALYKTLSAQGVEFGPKYRILSNLYLSENEAIAQIKPQPFSTSDRSLILLHPALLDAGIQLLGFCSMKICGVSIPFNIRSTRLFITEEQPEELWAHCRMTAISGNSVEGTVTLFGNNGKVFAILEGLVCRRVHTASETTDSLFETEWVPVSQPSKIVGNGPSFFISDTALKIDLPPQWITATTDEIKEIPAFKTIAFFSLGTESDIEFGLSLLQQVNTTTEQIIFITTPSTEIGAALWALVRTFRLERPEIRVRCIECTIDKLSEALTFDSEDEVSIRQDGKFYVPRLSRCQDICSEQLKLNKDATYLISGGLGALGKVAAKFLIEREAKYIVLLSRSSNQKNEISLLKERANIECLECNVQQLENVQEVRNWLKDHNWPQVKGIIHTAAVLADGTIPNQSPQKLQLAFGAKVDGAKNLHSVFSSLDFFILYSSAAATFGSVGQGSYAAANGALDALAQTWSQSGENVLSVQWGAWSEEGMAVRHGAVKRAEISGFGSISNELGTAILEQLIVSKKRGTVCVSPIDWNRLSIDTELVSRFKAKRTPAADTHKPSSYNKHSDGDLLTIVRQAAREAMGRTTTDDAPLMANGLDSLGAVVLAQSLSQKLGLSLGSIFALNYPTIEEMAKALASQLQNSQKPIIKPVLPNSVNPKEPIAVVGMACRLPGNVSTPQEFWDMLLEEKDCVTEIPYSRFDIDEVYDANIDAPGCSYTRKGAFIENVEFFDHDFFGISVAEAKAMDPHQRLLLEVSYQAFHNAGYDIKDLRGSDTGVFVGVANQDWMIVCGDEGARNPFFGPGVSSSIISNRISHLLGLTGPSMTIDTACSSSLVAIDLAVEKLHSGACSKAIVGGVNLMLHHRTFVGCCAAKMLSVKGRCAAFEESADGYCRGEGAGAVILKRLSDAQADGDQILAVIRGTAVNQDGRSATLTAPNGIAQEAVLNRALAIAGLHGSDVDYVECHGTGTSLGDPIEFAALKNVLGIDRTKPLVLGAVKTNIGHLEGAAGVAGFIKAVQVLLHHKAPGNVHFKNLNPKIDTEGFNVIVPKSAITLTKGPLKAGISSFGFGGTNAHVVIESYDGASIAHKENVIYKPRFLPWRRFPHPYLSRQDDSGYVTVLSKARTHLWKDHRINDEVIVPAASHIVLISGAFLLEDKNSLGAEINEIVIPRPLIIKDDNSVIHCSLKGNGWCIQREKEGIKEEFAFCKNGRVLTTIERTDLNTSEIQNRCSSTDVSGLYHSLQQQGMQFGPGYRNLYDLYLGEEEAIACIKLNIESTEERALSLLHPAALDAGIQLLGICGMNTCGLCVPFTVRTSRLFSIADQPTELWAYVRVNTRNSSSIEGDLTIFAENGEVFAVLEGLTLKTIHENKKEVDSLYETEWVPTTFTSPIASSSCLFLSRTEFDGAIIVSDEEKLEPILTDQWSRVALISSGSEADVELGLKILQSIGDSVKEIIFIKTPESVADAGLLGLARTSRLERPELRIRCIQCPSDKMIEVLAYEGEDELLVDLKGVPFVPRLRRIHEKLAKELVLRPDATYIISGGQGALGIACAKLLISRGAKNVALLTRFPKQIPELLDLCNLARIESIACDVSNKEDVLKAHQWLLRNEWPTVRGVVHTAGVLTDGIIQNQSTDKLRQAYACKVHGACHLRSVFTPQDFLVLYSSAAALFGSVGQASYAAANITLDAYAECWSRAGENVISIQWGAWSDSGMAVRHDAVKRAEAAGFGSIPAILGASILEHLLSIDKRGSVCATPIDWSSIRIKTPLISRFKTQKFHSNGNHIKGGNIVDLLPIVRHLTAEAIGRVVADDIPLMANGLDSLSAVILAQSLSQKLGLSLGSVFALNYPTIEAMVQALNAILEEHRPMSVSTPRTTQPQYEEPIAVVSASCRLPGNVGSLDEFWGMLVNGTDCVTDIPTSRFNIEEFYDPNPNAIGCSYTKRGAFMDEVDSFDHEFFGIPVVEARAMDPQQRLLLEVAYEAFYHAGYDMKSLQATPIGVFVGQMNHDWAHMNRRANLSDPYFGAGSSASITSNRISYLLGLTGPSMTLDTACSSSLVAVDLAVEKLRRGICSAALVAGVNVMLSYHSFVGCCAAKMLSFQGRCATFDAAADGYCRGEGVGAVILKRLSTAQADGNQILAIIRGTAVNQDGRSASLTAPNGLAQEAVITQALNAAGIKGSEVDYVECHGTGTALGDPIEVAALKNVLGKDRNKPVVLGAVKSNIGHLEGAAGIVGLIKAIQVLRHRAAPANVHFKTLNPKIDLRDFNAMIPTQLIQLNSKILIAGVSSFGFGGTNAHVILEANPK